MAVEKKEGLAELECPKCHFANPKHGRYCGKCGAHLLLPEDDSISQTKTYQSPGQDLTTGSTFADRYQIIEELGKGGMGRVYKVIDKKIDEEVALKLIKPSISADKKTIDRFANELRMARKVSHRNVCRMYHLGEDEGLHYITMEFVRGESLKNMIGMMGQLSTGQAVAIAKQVSEGLAEAHRLGVIHRDLKPNNIMIDRKGNTRIMDFGIARSIDAKGITASGVMIGTPEYMSPEQVEGKETDRRSDIYALGVILYEMLTGILPFEGETPFSIALQHKSEKPQDPREINPQIPEDLSQLILKCLEKSKEKRFQTAEELFEELRRIEQMVPTTDFVFPRRGTTTSRDIKGIFRKPWLAIAALFAVVILAGLSILYFGRLGAARPTKQLTLAVLPFENLGAPEDEYFADGLTEEITSRIASLQGLGVISRTSAMRYKNTQQTIKQIGDELGVDYVIEGAVRWYRGDESRGRVRVTLQIIRVSDDTHLWAERYDRNLEDIFLVQSEIAEQVARQLDLTVLEPERQALRSKPTNNLEAYDYFLKGKELETRGWMSSNNDEFNKALEMYEKATELDPEFATAYISQAYINSRLCFFGIDNSPERLARARSAAERAIQLQPELPEAHMALALYYYWGLLDYQRALGVIESIQKARPNFITEILGYIQRRQGKWEQALETMVKAFELNPRYSQLAYEIGGANLSLQRYKEAERWFDRALSINPERITAQVGKAGIYVLSEGDTQSARALLEKMPHSWLTDYMWLTLLLLERKYEEAINHLNSLSYDSYEEQHFYFEKNLAYASVYYAMKNWSRMKSHAQAARTILEDAVREHPGDPRYQAALGLTYAYLGRKEEALQAGQRAVDIYPISKDAAFGPLYILNLARINTVVGEYNRAIGQLEYLLSIPSAEYLWQLVSAPLLKIDPMWDPLRRYSQFQHLLQESP